MSAHIYSYTQQLGEVLKGMFIEYRCRVIQKLSENEWVVGGKTYSTLSEAKDAIDSSYSWLKNSIK